MKDVENLLDLLARAAATIRQSGRRSRLQRADLLFKRETYADLELHLTTIILARPGATTVQFEFSMLNEIQQRLVLCNLKRRNRFCYAQKRGNTAKADISERISKTSRYQTSSEAIEATGFKLPTHGIDEASTRNEWTSSTIKTGKTGTSASALSQSIELPDLSAPQVVSRSSESTVMSTTVIDVEYPRPPKVRKGALIFQCPCYCQSFSITLSYGNRWKLVSKV